MESTAVLHPPPPTDTDLLLLDLRLDDRIDPERHNSTWLSKAHLTSFLCADTVTFRSTCTHSFSTDCLCGVLGGGTLYTKWWIAVVLD